MKFAIIAAGQGSRLKQEGISEDKPLVQLLGQPMLSRLIHIFTLLQASEILIITNTHMPAVVRFIRQIQDRHNSKSLCPLTLLVKDTPSSMHSFYELSPYLAKESFCLTTVDTVFREIDFCHYIRAFHSFSGDALMAVTDYIDDEKPLYVATTPDLTITGFHDTQDNYRYISGGIYCMTPNVMPTLHRCIARGQSRMRNFQRQLIADGLNVKAYPFPKILDIDHAHDILLAEQFLQTE